MKRSWVAATILLLLAGCNSQPVSPGQLSGIKTIGVISLIGEEFSLTNRGITVFGNSVSQGSIADWNIDGRISDRVAAALEPRFDVKPVIFERSAFGRGIFFSGSHAFARMDDGSERSINDALGDSPAQHFDAYLVITKTGTDVTPTAVGTSLEVGGLGLYHAHPPFVEYTQLHALYRISLVDGADDSLLGASDAILPNSCREFTGPCRDVSPSLWTDTFEALTATQKQQLRAETEAIIDGSILPTLQALNLVASGNQ